MSVQDPPARRPTVSKSTHHPRAPRRRQAPSARAPRRTARDQSNPLLSWIKRESLALVALSGAALTTIAELGKVILLSPQISDILAKWQEITRAVWRPPLELAGLTVHPDLIAALNVAAFLTLLGVGARLSARLSGTPLAPMAFGRFFDDQTWPSLLAFGALCLVFLLGHGSDDSNVLSVWGSQEIGKYAFAIIVTAGYFAGDFIGHRAFHLRLYRLIALVAILVAANFALIHRAALIGG